MNLKLLHKKFIDAEKAHAKVSEQRLKLQESAEATKKHLNASILDEPLAQSIIHINQMFLRSNEEHTAATLSMQQASNYLLEAFKLIDYIPVVIQQENHSYLVTPVDIGDGYTITSKVIHDNEIRPD